MKLSWKELVRKKTRIPPPSPFLRIKVFEGGGTERRPYDGFVTKNGNVFFVLTVGTDWLNKNLNKRQFAEYIADRMNSKDGLF